MGFKEKGFELLHIQLLTYCMNDNDEMKPTKKDKMCYKKPQAGWYTTGYSQHIPRNTYTSQ